MSKSKEPLNTGCFILSAVLS